MEQKLAPPGRLMVLTIAMRVVADMGVEQPSLIALHLGKAVFELNTAILGGLDLCASERESGFKAFEQMIIMPGMTIIAQDLDTRLHNFDRGLRRTFFSTQRQESQPRQAFMWKFPGSRLRPIVTCGLPRE